MKKFDPRYSPAVNLLYKPIGKAKVQNPNDPYAQTKIVIVCAIICNHWRSFINHKVSPL